MPNWCRNQLTLTGPANLIANLVKGGFNLSKIISCPKILTETMSPALQNVAEENLKKYGYKDWYDWSIKNWGTKWDIHAQINLIKGKTTSTAIITFDSAWSPPIEAIQRLWRENSSKGLLVKLEYIESGAMFIGKITNSIDQCFSYENSKELSKLIKRMNHFLGENELDSLLDFEKEANHD